MRNFESAPPSIITTIMNKSEKCDKGSDINECGEEESKGRMAREVSNRGQEFATLGDAGKDQFKEGFSETDGAACFGTREVTREVYTNEEKWSDDEEQHSSRRDNMIAKMSHRASDSSGA